jgi:hypothetical protein
MTIEEKQGILSLLDIERKTVLFPGMTRFSEQGIIRDIGEDGTSGEIVYSASSEEDVDDRIRQQIQLARTMGHTLEWKLYGHDQPSCLGERLTAAGFEADDREAFLVLRVTPEALARFGDIHADIRPVTAKDDFKGLADVQRIAEEVHGESRAAYIEHHRFMLEHYPDYMSLYVAYVEDEPAACGRTYFHPESRFAGMYGGQTREKFRKRGLFTQIVATRVREALRRGVTFVTVDALPTSEPILVKRGFTWVTYTQPYHLPA